MVRDHSTNDPRDDEEPNGPFKLRIMVKRKVLEANRMTQTGSVGQPLCKGEGILVS